MHAGKSEALNAALLTVRTGVVATIDADTLLLPYALKRAVGRMLSSPTDTVAVAGSVLVRNSRANLLARVQEWDYFLAIASVKRQQSLFQGTLVAQGAFSVYRTEAVRRVGGWPDKIGEDIVLTWALIRNGGRTIFEPTAIAFTDAPVRLRHFVRQRRRWARGMIEGLREHGPSLLRGRRLHVHAVAANCLFPYLDTVYTIALPVGVVLALSGNFLIVGPMTAAVLPISLTIALTMYLRQRAVFRALNLRVRRNLAGFLLYVLAYQLLMSPISVSGYATELVRSRRVW
jgi:biofilm PGA synthesis N-glycosyltransferase PgaC